MSLTRIKEKDIDGNEVVTDQYRFTDEVANGTYTISYDGKSKTLHFLSPSIADGSPPKRNHYGIITEENDLASGYNDIFPLDSYITRVNAETQAPNAIPFFPTQSFGNDNHQFIQNPNNDYPHFNDWLLHFISTKGTIDLADFDKLLRYFCSMMNIQTGNEENGNEEYNSLRRRVLNRLEWNGYVEVNYHRNKIHILPPTLVCLPTTMGVLTMIVGARTPELVNQIIQLCNENENLSWYFQINMDAELPKFPLPNVIYVRSHIGGQFRDLSDFANKIGLIFKRFPNNIPVLPQLSTLSMFSSVDEYLDSIRQKQPSNDIFGDWGRHRLFNLNELRFQRATQELVDELLFVPADRELRNHYRELQPCFIEAKFDYKDHHYIRLAGNWYLTDKHWGRLIAVKYHLLNGNNLRPFRYDSQTQTLYILATIVFPIPITRSLVMMSGELPQIQVLDNRKFNAFKNVPATFAHNLIYKLLGDNYLVQI